MPHGGCYLWQSDLLWLHVVFDGIIGLSYFSIPLTLYYFARKGGALPFKSALYLFVAFVFACGLTHLMNIWNVWNPDYYIAGFLKAITGIISLATAIILWPLASKAVQLPNLFSLQEANQVLTKEISRREVFERELQAKAQLLSESNAQLTQLNRMMLGRETKMIQLKQEINELSESLGRPCPYLVEGR